jgi:YcaO-like protein with predicted kinase domain
MQYELKLMNTLSGVGCFAAAPGPNLSFTEVLQHLEEHPFDEFMHRHMLEMLGNHRQRKIEKLINEARGNDDKKVLAALLFEACLTHMRLKKLLPIMEKDFDAAELSRFSPTLHLRSYLLKDQPIHNKWISMFNNNMECHAQLQIENEIGPRPEFNDDAFQKISHTAEEIRASLKKENLLPAPLTRRPLEETYNEAIAKLEALDIFAGPEMRHKACLSPNSILRHWMVKTRTDSGSFNNSLRGLQTSYGRGFSLDQARTSCAMEVVERVSSYASIAKTGIQNRKTPQPLVHGSYSEVAKEAVALDPDTIPLEAPYQDQPLWWMPAQKREQNGLTNALVPVQHVFLFNNLDEQNLFSGLSSTGLASGNTVEEARLSGILEVLERDSDATVPFDINKCFRISTNDSEIDKFLFDLETTGTQVWFQDMTSELGVPCYRCFAVGRLGDVNRGGGCNLNGKKALLSALTETPYPYPGPPTTRRPKDLPIRKLEELPDYSTGGANGDLMVLENLLLSNGLSPYYADLTRKDLEFPVTRAIIPGLEIVSDMDKFSRVSPRLYRNYLEMISGN